MIYDDRVLLYFRTIAKECSISKAADKLYISQSSLSKFLKTIEDEVGTKLIDRKTIPIRLTLAGEKFLQYLEQSSEFHKKTMLELLQTGSEAPKEIIIGASSMNSRMVSDAFPEFYNCYPSIQLTLLEAHSEKLGQLLARKKIDMAVLVRNGNDLCDQSVFFEPLISQPRYIVVSKKNPLANIASSDNSIDHPEYIDIHQLENQKLIAGKAGQRIFEDINELVKKYGLSTNGFLETQSIGTMVSFATKNYGISFIPPYYLKRFLPLDELVFFYSDYPELQWTLTIESSSPFPSVPEKHFASVLKKVFSKY